jgi:hypothetical protein
MDGYVAQRRGRFYVVIYKGRDPVTGKELRRWHPADTDRVVRGLLGSQRQRSRHRRTYAGSAPLAPLTC